MAPKQIKFNVLETDYRTYASIYVCYWMSGIFRIENGFVLTRKSEPSEKLVSYALKVKYEINFCLLAAERFGRLQEYRPEEDVQNETGARLHVQCGREELQQ